MSELETPENVTEENPMGYTTPDELDSKSVKKIEKFIEELKNKNG